MNEIKCVSVRLNKIQAIIAVDVTNRRVEVVNCNYHDFCRVNGLLLNGECPAYCQAIVAAKSFAIWGRVRAETYIIEPEKCQFYMAKQEILAR
ncbi:hypothetical protein [Archaeoglobus veneficus]|uniref:Uncharacterized protein n=1 Tax=Archaeoglobus veneficus (strain DSM 11195 / SNP6) TaxID=693661 RepID=F2KPP8_ARCVS|nr:hypothetical protein [Archaeoglobus veneficus]AEA47576.1 hypothetical protein Arcve_1576 [Archaeoglobus veneficus SNP6]